MTLTPEEQAAQAAQAVAQDPPAATNPPPVQPAPASQGGTPWDADLAGLFPDEATRSTVSDYLRTRVQPHITKLEQSAVESAELLNDFRTNPDVTFIEVAEELYPDLAETFKAQLDSRSEPAANEPDPWNEPPQRDPEVQALIDWRKQEDEREAYDSEFARVSALEAQRPEDERVTLDSDLLKPFVAATGDFDQAVTQYRGWIEQMAASNAPTPDPDPALTTDTAPPTLGTGEAGGTSAPETQKEYANYHDAIDDWAADMAASGQSAAPPVPNG